MELMSSLPSAFAFADVSEPFHFVLVFSIFYAIYLSLIKREGMSLTPGRFV